MSLFRKKTLLATLPIGRVENLAGQDFIKETALAEKMGVEETAAIGAFFQEFFGFNILDREKIGRDKVGFYLTKTIMLHKKGFIVFKKSEENFLIFSTVSTERLKQEMMKNP